MKIVNKASLKAGIRTRGFTLVELLLALGIAGIIAAFAISISSSISGLSKQAMSKARMETIAAKARQYYRSHKVQVGGVERKVVSNKTTWSVPVGGSGLNLEPKYRFDGWGHFLYYRACNVITSSSDFTSISDFDLKTSSVKAGLVIISAGPDQMFGPKGNFVVDIVDEDDDFKNIYYDSSSSSFLVAVSNSDDVIYWVNFNQEATEITLEELQVLQDKVEAFDAMFEGIDNDGDDKVDEDKCQPSSDYSSACTGVALPFTPVADPNCGRATLDKIGDYYNSGCISEKNACEFIVNLYGLSSQYLMDPWGNPYQWSDSSDRKHHKFWSFGPDGDSGTDDDIVF